jgi:eukaryotic-like serine/threonine-protein kinase
MVGQNIGKYRVLERVGRGGMGTVYRAIDETLHREVAIKVLNAELNDPEVAKRFRAEAITVARLSHPGIATIYELFQHEGQWLMVMEFVRGETLERLVERAGAQLPARAAELCMQSLAALAHAHSMGVVHRDLKPANIMVTESGTVKIMDFGIARVAGTEHLTNVGFMMGTPAYMAPEQVLGHEIDARADIYAMGVVFYRLLTAQLPFKGETPFAMAQAQVNNPPTPIGTFRADLPPWVDEIMSRSLAKKPDDRFQSAIEFHESFARCLAGQPMASSYDSSAPTGLMMTPPRALPTGSIERTMLATPTGTSAAIPGMPVSVPVPVNPTDAAPTMAGTPVATSRPATEPVAAAPGSTPAATAQSGAVSVPPAPAPTASGAAAPQKKTGGMGLVAAAAVVIVVGGAGAFFWMRPRHQAPPVETPAPVADQAAPAALTPADTPPAPLADAAPPAAPPATATTSGAAPSRATSAPSAAAGATTSGPTSRSGAAGDVTGGDARRGGAAAASASRAMPAAPAAPVDDTHVAFTDIKLFTVTGKKTRDDDVLLTFVAGKMTVLAKKDSQVILAWPYKSVARATYVKARDPKWDASMASPPDGLDVGGAFRTSKHWLVLQNKDEFLVLRLADSNVTRMIEVIEARAGITVTQIAPDSDKK